MNCLILAGIRLYWRLIPPERRRTCLFRTSCSHHVYDTARAAGTWKAMVALWNRIRTCRPGYLLLNIAADDGSRLVRLANGRVVNLDLFSETVRQNILRRAQEEVDVNSLYSV